MRATTPIRAALTAHRHWKDRLKRAIADGGSEFQPATVRLDNQCDFGKWLYHQVSPDMQQSPHYETVRQLHARFHQEAARVLDLAAHGRRREAETALRAGGAFAEISTALSSELMAWHLYETNTLAAAERAPAPDRMKAVLAERAKALTRSTETPAGDSLPLVVFSLAGERYGVATDWVREVQPLRGVTPVPCTPGFVVGVINIRGSIYSVVDIRGFFGVPQQAIGESTKVILVAAAGLELGILADDVSGATSVPLSEVKPPMAAQVVAQEEFIRGVTQDMLIVLDLEALLRDERIVVREEVG
jgi:purine-binding chemotaxis protein CheW